MTRTPANKGTLRYWFIRSVLLLLLLAMINLLVLPWFAGSPKVHLYLEDIDDNGQIPLGIEVQSLHGLYSVKFGTAARMEVEYSDGTTTAASLMGFPMTKMVREEGFFRGLLIYPRTNYFWYGLFPDPDLIDPDRNVARVIVVAQSGVQSVTDPWYVALFRHFVLTDRSIPPLDDISQTVTREYPPETAKRFKPLTFTGLSP